MPGKIKLESRQKTEVEIQQELEQERSHVRQKNSKLYDQRLNKLIQGSDNGAQHLRQEVRSSDCRLKSVKSGLPLGAVVQST
jgi:hypothetical protein